VVGRLRNWIARDGGSLVCYRGSPVAAVSEQLAGMMPVRWSPGNESRFRIRLTDRGQSVDWLTAANPGDRDALSKLPSLAMHAKPERPKPLSVVLAQTGDSGPPVVTYQPYGTGRVVTIEGAGMWRWAFLAPQFREHDTLYGAVWQSLVRWLVSSVGLAPGQDLLLRTDKVTHQVGESVTALLLVREVSRQSLPAIELSRNDEPLTDQFSVAPLGDDPGVYQVSFGRLPEGRYRARVVGRDDVLGSSVAFDVRPFLGEQLDLAARGDILTRIVSETGGTMMRDVSSTEIGRRFREHLSRSRPERTRRLTAWDRWWVFVVIVGLWTSAWTLRRSGGLV